MKGVTYIDHKGPNNLFTGIVAGNNINGTNLGTIFNVECDVVKGETTTKGNVTLYVTPDTFNADGSLATKGRTYIQVRDGSSSKLVEVESVSHEEIEVHTVSDTTTTSRLLTVKKTVVVLNGVDGEKYTTPVEVVNNGQAAIAIETLTNRNATSRKTLQQMKDESKETTVANLPDTNESIFEAGLSIPSTTNPTRVLGEDNPNICYSRIRVGDPRVDRFSTTRYQNRDDIEEIGIEYYLTFKHSRVGPPGEKPIDISDRIAVTTDYHGQNYVTMTINGREKNYSLLGMGTERPPVKEGETSYTENEVVYIDVINEQNKKERIYLPAEKGKNKDFIENLQNTIQNKNELHKMDEVTTPPPTVELSNKLMNKVFDEDRIPLGPLSYQKDDITYLYIPHGRTQDDYLRFMQKEGKVGLYVNLNGVERNSTPPSTYPNGTTFEVVDFIFGSDGSTPPSEVLKMIISDGTERMTVDTAITRAQAEASALYDRDNSRLLFPTEVMAGRPDPKISYISVDENTYPNCKNKTVTATETSPAPTGNLVYERFDSDGSLIKDHYISHGFPESHFHLMEKNNQFYANFNTGTTVETCRIVGVTRDTTSPDKCTVTYIAGNPDAQKYTGELTLSATAITELENLCAGRPLANPEIPISNTQLPPAANEIVTKNPVVEFGDDGVVKTNGNRKVGQVALITETPNFMGLSGVKGFSQDILLADGSRQSLTTFHSDTTLLTISEHETNTPVATFNVGGTSGLFTASDVPNAEMVLAVEKANELGLNSYGIPDGTGNLVFPIDAMQISQNGAAKDIIIKAGGADVRVSFSSQGIVASTPAGPVRKAAENPPLDIGISDTYYNNAINIEGGITKPLGGCTVERDAKGNIVNKDLNGAILESFVRQQRDAVKAGKNPLEPMKLADGSLLYSIPVQVKNTASPTIYLDYMVSADGTVYQYQHRTKEAKEGAKGGEVKPGWQRVEQVVFRQSSRSSDEKYFVATLNNDSRASTPVSVKNTNQDAKPTLGVSLKDFENNEVLMALFTGKMQADLGLGKKLRLKTPSEVTSSNVDGAETGKTYTIPVDINNSDHGSVLVGDDGLAQLQRYESTENTYEPVAQIVEPSRAVLESVDQINDPKERKLGTTIHTITPDEAKPKKPKQIWKGISDRKAWVAFLALATVFSIALPFLGIVAGILLGIFAASENEIFGDLKYTPSYYRQRVADREGRQIERTMMKNKDNINTLNTAIKVLDDKIEKINGNTNLTEAQKSAKLRKLNAERSGYISQRDSLIRENERLVISLAQHSDSELLSLKKEQRKVERITERIDDLKTRFGLVDHPESADRATQMRIIRNILDNEHPTLASKRILKEQQAYLALEQAREDDRDLSDEEKNLAKKCGFDQSEFNRMKELEEKRNSGEISEEEEKLLKALMKKYGKSPLEILKDWFDYTSERVDEKTEHVVADAENFNEAHPENGYRDITVDQTPAPAENETRASENPYSGPKVGTRKAYKERTRE